MCGLVYMHVHALGWRLWVSMRGQHAISTPVNGYEQAGTGSPLRYLTRSVQEPLLSPMLT